MALLIAAGELQGVGIPDLAMQTIIDVLDKYYSIEHIYKKTGVILKKDKEKATKLNEYIIGFLSHPESFNLCDDSGQRLLCDYPLGFDLNRFGRIWYPYNYLDRSYRAANWPEHLQKLALKIELNTVHTIHAPMLRDLMPNNSEEVKEKILTYFEEIEFLQHKKLPAYDEMRLLTLIEKFNISVGDIQKYCAEGTTNPLTKKQARKFMKKYTKKVPCSMNSLTYNMQMRLKTLILGMQCLERQNSLVHIDPYLFEATFFWDGLLEDDAWI
jgi:hypothetical protein